MEWTRAELFASSIQSRARAVYLNSQLQESVEWIQYIKITLWMERDVWMKSWGTGSKSKKLSQALIGSNTIKFQHVWMERDVRLEWNADGNWYKNSFTKTPSLFRDTECISNQSLTGPTWTNPACWSHFFPNASATQSSSRLVSRERELHQAVCGERWRLDTFLTDPR